MTDASAAADRLLPWKTVRDITGLSRTTAWRRQKAGDFPAPVVISPGRVGWPESEITAWKASRRRRGAPPAETAAPPRSFAPPAQPPEDGKARSATTPARVGADIAAPARGRVAPDQLRFDF